MHSINYLREYLIYIINDRSIKNKHIVRTKISLPMRIELPRLIEVTVDVRAKVKEDVNTVNGMEIKCNDTRQRLIEEGTRDEMKMRQPTYAPDLKVAMNTKYAFRYADEDGFNDEVIEWFTDQVTKNKNGSNMWNGPKCYRKGGTTEAQWDAYSYKCKKVSVSIVEIR